MRPEEHLEALETRLRDELSSLAYDALDLFSYPATDARARQIYGAIRAAEEIVYPEPEATPATELF